METEKLKIEYVKLSEIKPYENNAKQHPKEQIEQIKKSIKEFGNIDPIGVWHGEIVEGHGRYIAAKQLKLDEVPIIRLDNLTNEERKAYALVHNKLTMNSDFDTDLLSLELDSIEDIDMSDFGFNLDFDDEDDKEPGEIEEDEVTEDVDSRCHIGDLWQLGNHRLICGDSTDVNVIERLMDGVKAELCLTDPPYGVKAVESGGHNNGKKFGNCLCHDNVYEPIIGDDTTETAQASYHVAVINSDNQIIFGGNYFTDFLPPSRCWIVWDKKVGDCNFADGELAWTSFDKNLKIYEHMWSGMRRQGDRDIEGKKRVHPTQKPVGLMANILNDFASPKSAILDLFGGSGSTLIACEQTKRSCYMCELSEHYCDVIINRWEQLTGEEAVLLSDVQTDSPADIPF